MPLQAHTRVGRLSALLAIAASTAIAGADEDWRKILDRLPPVLGPVWTADMPSDDLGPRGVFSSQGVQLLANIPLNNFAGFHSFGNDCWGYVSPSGREYAIMGLERGFGFVEITTPTSPVIVGVINGPQSDWHDIKVIGDRAYGVSEGGSGVQVIDLSNIDSGSVSLIRNATPGGFTTAHNIVSNPDSGRIFIVGANVGNGGIVELDLANPDNPSLGSGWTTMYVHDAQVVSYTEGPYAGRELAFLCSGFDGGQTSTGLRVVDVTNPNSFFLLETFFYSSAGYSHQAWASPDKTRMYLNDEFDESFGLVPSTTTRILDISDPANISQVGTFTTGLASIDHNLYMVDEVMLQANYRTGLRVINASDLDNPVEVGFFDTFPGSNAAAYNGAWSSYPFFPSGTVIVSDIERGLFVFEVDALAPRLLVTPSGEQPEFITPDGQSLSVEVAERNLGIDELRLNFITSQGPVSTVLVSPSEGVIQIDSPDLPCGETVEYWFEAVASNGVSYTLPADILQDRFTARVATDVLTPFADDFQTNQGWTVSTNASDGGWTRGVPVGGGDRGDPPIDSDGSGACYLTDNADDNTDVDSGSTTLTSPAMDASAPGSVLSYATWFSNVAGSAPNEAGDVLLVEISNNNGGSWTTLEVVGPGGPQASGGWFESSFDLESVFPSPSSSLRVRFTASDVGDGSVVEAGVDAVRIDAVECAQAQPCSSADFVEPLGALDFNDVVAFLSAFAAGDPSADFATPIGAFDFNDVVGFLTSFAAGCP